jgi:hypothetical protein
MNPALRRAAFVFLCAFPFITLALVNARNLRVDGVYQTIGGALFAAIVVAAWILGARMIAASTSPRRRGALAGLLLIFPWAIIALLWVGLGAPFQATASENHMRFLVLLASAVVVSGAFVVLNEELEAAGERFHSTIGFAASVSAGAAYLVCISMSLASTIAQLSGRDAVVAGGSDELYSALEFVACITTYVATAAFATSLARVGWLGRNSARAYAAASALLVTLIAMRGVSFPALSDGTAPWYASPAFVAGIPAIPWLMPCFLGIVVLRRAGNADDE